MKYLLYSGAVLLSLVMASSGQSKTEPPTVINNPDPVYPAEAGTLGYDGSVIVHIEVNKKGTVTVKRSYGPAAPCSNLVDSRVEKIRKAVVEAAKQAQFEPSIKDGKPVDVEMKLTYRFDETGQPLKERKPTGKIVEAGVLQGRVKHLARPDYPASAKAIRAGGAVPIGVVVGTDGKVIAAGPVGGHHYLWDAASKAACASSIEPVVLSGQPVRVSGILIYQFVP